jgi:DNA-binding GntR family transcriptional regulator
VTGVQTCALPIFYELLWDKIIWLDLAPESILNLSELAEDYNLSRTPVKEALLLLQTEGWVLRNGSHFIVTPLSLDRIKEITEIRAVLEVQANVWAMQRISSPELAEIKDLRQKILACNDPDNNRHIVQLDFAFHRVLFRATRNTQLASLLDRLLAHYLRFWLSLNQSIELPGFFAEALAIIEAVEKKDEEAIRAVTIEHMRRSVERILSSFFPL